MSREHHRNALPENFRLEEYLVDSVLGHGGFGITYLAKDTNLEQWVAIKEYLPNDLAVREGLSTVYAKSTSDETAFGWGLERFIMEARTLAHFHHPNIVRVIRYFSANRTAYMVMEYIEGDSLSMRIKRQPLNEEESPRRRFFTSRYKTRQHYCASRWIASIVGLWRGTVGDWTTHHRFNQHRDSWVRAFRTIRQQKSSRSLDGYLFVGRGDVLRNHGKSPARCDWAL